jgi:hypothetical protein
LLCGSIFFFSPVDALPDHFPVFFLMPSPRYLGVVEMMDLRLAHLSSNWEGKQHQKMKQGKKWGGNAIMKIN